MDVGVLRRLVRTTLVGLACILIVSGCQRAFSAHDVRDSDRAFAERMIQALQSADDGPILAVYTPGVEAFGPKTAPPLESELPGWHAQIPSGDDVSPRLVAARIEALTGARNVFLTYALDQGKRHAVVDVNFTTYHAETFLRSMRLSLNPMALEDMDTNPFSLSGRSSGHYFFLLFTVVSATITALAFIVLLRMPDIPRKWAWALGFVFGFGQFTLDWNSGVFTYAFMRLQLPVIWIEKLGPLAPWHISFGIPLIAYIFLLTHVKPRGHEVATSSH